MSLGPTDSLPIIPFTQPSCHSVKLPGSKSITNRSLLLAALSDQKVTIENALFSRDTDIMVRALSILGFDVKPEKGASRITISGQKGHIPRNTAELDVGNAGTAARFLTAFLCLKEGGSYRLDGDREMRTRPMAELLEALVSQGAEVEYEIETGCFPFHLRTNGLRGGSVQLDTNKSSQFVSAFLLAAPKGKSSLELKLKGKTVSKPFIGMTLRMMEQFGAEQSIRQTDSSIVIKVDRGYHLPTGIFNVEPDATAASYFIILPLASGKATVNIPLPSNSIQGDIRFANTLAKITNLNQRTGEKGRTFSFSSSRILKSGVTGIDLDFSEISDTFLTLAAIAPLLEGPSRITGIGHTRHQETDRIAAVSEELRKLGQVIEEELDAITIRPNRQKLIEKATEGISIETYQDHRMAMSFSILGSNDILGNGQPWLSIINPSSVGKTFPQFFEVLRGFHQIP